MTGAHAAGTPGHGSSPDPQPDPQPDLPSSRHRRLAWRIGTPAVVLLSGALFATSAVDSKGTDLRPGRYSDLASVVNAEARDFQLVETQRHRLTDEVDELTKDVGSHGVHRARHRIDRLEDPAGLTPREGEGISITLSDAPTDVLDKAVSANDPDLDLNRLVVHQQDIQAVVNALWTGGASAVTIAGQRVVATTGIKCEGNAVQLQGVPYPQPYVIQAVGDPIRLTASIDADPLVSGFRVDAANPTIDVGWSLVQESHVVAPAYSGLVDMRYAKPLTTP
jgi:uncharacterized protein YlxW (UPF0749 family)